MIKMYVIPKSRFGVIPVFKVSEWDSIKAMLTGEGLSEISDFNAYHVRQHGTIDTFRERFFCACTVLRENGVDLGMILGIFVVFPDSQSTLRESEEIEIVDIPGISKFFMPTMKGGYWMQWKPDRGWARLECSDCIMKNDPDHWGDDE